MRRKWNIWGFQTLLHGRENREVLTERHKIQINIPVSDFQLTVLCVRLAIFSNFLFKSDCNLTFLFLWSVLQENCPLCTAYIQQQYYTNASHLGNHVLKRQIITISGNVMICLSNVVWWKSSLIFTTISFLFCDVLQNKVCKMNSIAYRLSFHSASFTVRLSIFALFSVYVYTHLCLPGVRNKNRDLNFSLH